MPSDDSSRKDTSSHDGFDSWRLSMKLIAPGLTVSLAIMALGDVFRMYSQAPRFLKDSLDVFALVGISLGLYLWTGLWLVVGGGGLLAIVTKGHPAESLQNIKNGVKNALRTQNSQPPWGTRIIAASLAVGSYVTAMYIAMSWLTKNVNTPELLTLVTVAASIGTLLPILVVYRVLEVLLGRVAQVGLFKKLLHLRIILTLLTLELTATAVMAIIVERTAFKSLDGWALYVPLISLVAGTVVTLWAPDVLEKVHGPRFLTYKVGKWAVATVLAITMSAGLLLASHVDGARALFLTFSRNGSQIADVWGAVFDFDRDGATTFLAGTDCAPFNRHVYPGAPEIPDNKVDEDCLDGDLIKPKNTLVKPLLKHPLKEPKKPDVILISIDGCRRDALGVYGAPATHTPILDEFAKGAVVFDDAVSPASWTMPSFASIWTSRYADEIPGFYSAGRMKAVPGDIPVLTEPFKKAGYDTVAVTAGLQLDKQGIQRGFDDWRPLTKTPKGSFGGAVADASKEVIEKAKLDKPLFLWAHLIDAHHPYSPPGKFKKFGNDRRGLYTAEIHYADDAIGKILKALDDSGRTEKAIVVVFADHGEAFREHGTEFHGTSTYAEEVRVPFMVRVPGVEPRREDDLVGTIDLAPTIWDLAGLSAPGAIRGRSLGPLIVSKERLERRNVFTAQTRKKQEFALTTPRYKLRYDQSMYRFELFDRRNDPSEQYDIAKELPHVTSRLRVELAKTMSAISHAANRGLGDVLLRRIPKDFIAHNDQFAGGARLVGSRWTEIKNRAVSADFVFESQGVIEGKLIEIKTEIVSPDNINIGTHKGQIGGGIHPPSRWRDGELIKHKATIKTAKDIPNDARICVSMIVDQTILILDDNQIRRCFDLN